MVLVQALDRGWGSQCHEKMKNPSGYEQERNTTTTSRLNCTISHQVNRAQPSPSQMCNTTYRNPELPPPQTAETAGTTNAPATPQCRQIGTNTRQIGHYYHLNVSAPPTFSSTEDLKLLVNRTQMQNGGVGLSFRGKE